MMSDMHTLYIRYPVFLWDMLFTLLQRSCLCAHTLLKFVISINHLQYTYKWSGSRTLATSMIEFYVTIVNYSLTANYYHIELNLRWCRDPRSLFAYTWKRFSDYREFSPSNMKMFSKKLDWWQFYGQWFIIHQQSLFCYKKSALSNKP